MWAHRPRSLSGPVWSRDLTLSMNSWNKHGVVSHCCDSGLSPRECEVSSPDLSLHFLEPCIRMQTSTSWTICSAQWMQESAGTCSNSEFAPVFYHLCFPGTLCASGDAACSALVTLSPIPSLHRRSILEKSCIMMKSGQENTAGVSSEWRTVGSVL